MVLDLSLPSGLRDLLPDHSAHLAELSARLHDVFSQFRYRRVFLPTLERLEVVERGLSPAALARQRREGRGLGCRLALQWTDGDREARARAPR